MENNIFKELCEKINYNTYTDIQHLIIGTELGLSLSRRIIPMDINISSGMAIASAALGFAFFLSIYSHGKSYTKDISEIRSLYNEFINNYKKLNRNFDLNNPIEIYTMFNYLLYKGYLSKNKEFNFSKKGVREVYGLSGINILNGTGVCRHISEMLDDILNSEGINSKQLTVHSGDYIINVDILKENKYTREELTHYLKKHSMDEDTYKMGMLLIEKLVDEMHQNIEISFKSKKDKNILTRTFGNHAITFAVYDDKAYFLDPTQSRIYRMSDTNRNTLCDVYGDVPIKLKTSIINDSLKNYKMLKENLSKPSIPLEEEQQLVEETKNICENNTDIFEHFYKNNSELYDEVSNKVLKLRKTIIR